MKGLTQTFWPAVVIIAVILLLLSLVYVVPSGAHATPGEAFFIIAVLNVIAVILLLTYGPRLFKKIHKEE